MAPAYQSISSKSMLCHPIEGTAPYETILLATQKFKGPAFSTKHAHSWNKRQSQVCSSFLLELTIQLLASIDCVCSKKLQKACLGMYWILFGRWRLAWSYSCLAAWLLQCVTVRWVAHRSQGCCNQTLVPWFLSPSAVAQIATWVANALRCVRSSCLVAWLRAWTLG